MPRRKAPQPPDPSDSRAVFRATEVRRDGRSWKTLVRGMKIWNFIEQLRGGGDAAAADELTDALNQDGVTATYLRLQREGWEFVPGRMAVRRRCEVCGETFHSIRLDAKTCSARCRQRRSRRRHTSPEPGSRDV